MWLIQGWYEGHWWKEVAIPHTGFVKVNCTDEQLLDFLHQQRTLAVNHYPLSHNQTQAAISRLVSLLLRLKEDLGSCVVVVVVWLLLLLLFKCL